MACALPVQCSHKFKTLLRLYFLPLPVLSSAALSCALLFLGTAEALLAGGLVAASLWAFIYLPIMLFERMYYTRMRGGIKLERGLFCREIIFVPRSQLLYVRLKRGPLERTLGLSTLFFVTAAGRVSLPGLSMEEAARMKSILDGQDLPQG